jgi:hypothetical protein
MNICARSHMAVRAQNAIIDASPDPRIACARVRRFRPAQLAIKHVALVRRERARHAEESWRVGEQTRTLAVREVPPARGARCLQPRPSGSSSSSGFWALAAYGRLSVIVAMRSLTS